MLARSQCSAHAFIASGDLLRVRTRNVRRTREGKMPEVPQRGRTGGPFVRMLSVILCVAYPLENAGSFGRVVF